MEVLSLFKAATRRSRRHGEVEGYYTIRKRKVSKGKKKFFFNHLKIVPRGFLDQLSPTKVTNCRILKVYKKGM